jgi:hypothetical protein
MGRRSQLILAKIKQLSGALLLTIARHNPIGHIWHVASGVAHNRNTRKWKEPKLSKHLLGGGYTQGGRQQHGSHRVRTTTFLGPISPKIQQIRDGCKGRPRGSVNNMAKVVSLIQDDSSWQHVLVVKASNNPLKPTKGHINSPHNEPGLLQKISQHSLLD